jgi:hypothetical protein
VLKEQREEALRGLAHEDNPLVPTDVLMPGIHGSARKKAEERGSIRALHVRPCRRRLHHGILRRLSFSRSRPADSRESAEVRRSVTSQLPGELIAPRVAPT